MTKTIITTALVALAIAATVPAAFAARTSETVTFKVSTAGLDLRNPQDVQNMLHRVENAARSLCGARPYPGDLDATHDYKACVSYNVGQAVSELGLPMAAAANPRQTATRTASNGH